MKVMSKVTPVSYTHLFHHERLDGTGYPFGKTAVELNTQERMMACIDIYQALTESRPYKPVSYTHLDVYKRQHLKYALIHYRKG